MLKDVLWWLFGVFCLVNFVAIIIFNIVHFACKWKCRKKRYDCFFNRCRERDCLFRCFCKEYDDCTKEEIAKLKKILEDFENKKA